MAVGDKKPVVMEGDIGKTGGPAALVHASQHASGGADPITPDMIGAAPYEYLSDAHDALTKPDGIFGVDGSTKNTPFADGLVGTFSHGLIISSNYSTTDGYITLFCIVTGLNLAFLKKCVNGTWDTTWTQLATTDYAVNKAGDTMTGLLTISDGYITKMKLDNTAKDSLVTLNAGTNTGAIAVHNVKTMDGEKRELIVNTSAAQKLATAVMLKDTALNDAGNLVATSYNILHTGNKPYGSYTGNGDATYREIDTGGVQNTIRICSSYGMAIATEYGTFILDSSGAVSWTVSYYVNNGALVLQGTDKILNYNGQKYAYQVL